VTVLMTTLCGEVTAWLNHATQQTALGVTFTAVRKNLPITELEGTDALRVTVFPGPRTLDRVGRHRHSRKLQVFIAVQKRIVATTEAEQLAAEDALLNLSQKIEELIRDVSFTDVTRNDEEETSLPPYLLTDLETANLFTSVVTLTYYTEI
jgi:predicted transcriptional regulator